MRSALVQYYAFRTCWLCWDCPKKVVTIHSFSLSSTFTQDSGQVLESIVPASGLILEQDAVE